MSNKVALITGGASGIGLATSREFLLNDYTVILYDKDFDKLTKAKEILTDSPRVILAEGDVRSFSEVHDKAKELLSLVGRITVLINSAGVSMPKPVIEMEEDDWVHTVDINLKGAFNWVHALLPEMLKHREGKIINVSSVSAKNGGGVGTVSKACYAASKAGLLGFTRGLAKEVAPHILVNAVCPGIIQTPMTETLIHRSNEALLPLIPLKRFGRPEDVADAIFFLASPKANYITGEIIDINGGMFID